MTIPDVPDTTALAKVERMIDVRGVATHLFEAGSPTGMPLLYLHGVYLGNLWLDYHDALARHFHIFAPDMPGMGLSERPDWMRDVSDYVLYYRDLLDTLGLQAPFIVGHSLGGWMGAELAVFYPERVGKLVLSNAAGIRVKGSPIGDLFAMNPQEIVAACFEDPMAALVLMPREMNVDYVIQQYREATTLASLAWNPGHDPKLERRLARITCPTLILWGEKDRLIPPIYGKTFHERIPGSKLVMMEGAGHMPMFEQHTGWTQHIADFLLERGLGSEQEATA